MTLVNIDPHVIPHRKMYVSAMLIFVPGQLSLQHPVFWSIWQKKIWSHIKEGLLDENEDILQMESKAIEERIFRVPLLRDQVTNVNYFTVK